MNLRQRMKEVKQMAPGWEHYRAMSDVFPVLLDVVEQQREALEGLLLRYNALVNSGDCGNWNPEGDDDVIAARAALALMDKED